MGSDDPSCSRRKFEVHVKRVIYEFIGCSGMPPDKLLDTIELCCLLYLSLDSCKEMCRKEIEEFIFCLLVSELGLQ
jgi:hypothetical protein